MLYCLINIKRTFKVSTLIVVNILPSVEYEIPIYAVSTGIVLVAEK